MGKFKIETEEEILEDLNEEEKREFLKFLKVFEIRNKGARHD